MSVFGAAYAGAYDALYAGKDYDAECDVIEALFRRFATGPMRDILDVGCGTGGHALRLARRGYAVTGVDLSADMLNVAARKSASEGLAVRWLHGDVRGVDAGAPFDAALMMFAVLGYQHQNRDVLTALRNVRRHLRAEGLLIFDAWHGPGVIADPPRTSARVVQLEAGAVTRHARGRLDVRRHLCAVDYDLRSDDAPALPPLAAETHVVRFFFPMEIELFLQASGFELVQLGAVDEPDREAGAGDWNMLVVARASQ